ncbi:hypothetical protein B9Z55_017210 [Caenorhabditis nigoni]|uniref:Uncharacterized protein n=1 Tax=Caenorhabditis nigoni TaxID=1611254 RepID=A0A2G5T8X5_9PELO|nr:hypothetical protein B9Z55_017210 [Caenorhabditis nigoni]
MRSFHRIAVVLFIGTTLIMVRPENLDDKCRVHVNILRKGAGLGELKEDQQETARLGKNFWSEKLSNRGSS